MERALRVLNGKEVITISTSSIKIKRKPNTPTYGSGKCLLDLLIKR